MIVSFSRRILVFCTVPMETGTQAANHWYSRPWQR